MSAWLCQKGTLSLCVDVLKGMMDYIDKDEQELMDELSLLNTKSLDCRYGKSKQHILSDKEYIRLNVENGQRYKSVCCYLYQTCECEENYEHPLFKALENWTEDNRHYDEVIDNYHWNIDRSL